MPTKEEYLAAVERALAANDTKTANSLRKKAEQAESSMTETAAETPAGTVQDPAYEGAGQELFEGIGSGLIGIVEGPAQFAATLIDKYGKESGPTSKASTVAQKADSLRNYLGIDPSGVLGKSSEALTQYGLPTIGAAVLTGGGSLLAQLSAIAAADFLVTTDNYSGIANFFDGAPDVIKTENLDGLSGREEADARLRNRVRIAGEGFGIGAVAPTVIKTTGKVLGAGIEAIGGVPIVAPIARGLKKAGDTIGAKVGEYEEALRMGDDQGFLKNTIAEVAATLRYRGVLPEEVANERLLIAGRTEGNIKKAEALSKRLDQSMDKVFKRGQDILVNGTRMDRNNFLKMTDDILTAPTPAAAQALLDTLPISLKVPAQQMRAQLDEIRPLVLNSGFLQRNDYMMPNGQTMLSNVISQNTSEYMRRRFRIFEDVNYKPTEETLDIGLRGFSSDRFHTAQELKRVADNPTNNLTYQQVGLDANGDIVGSITPAMAEMARDAFLKRYAIKRRSPLAGLKTSRIASERVAPGMFVERVNLPGYQKALLGEVKNPLESYVATIADISEFLAVDKFQKHLAELATSNPMFQNLIKDTRGMSPNQLKILKDEGYVTLGKQLDDPTVPMGPKEALSEWGALNGYAVPSRIYKDLTRTVLGDMGVIGNGIRSAYSGFLRGKGFVQYGKTVLSPATQIRNVTSAAMFALAQGNVGTGANISESMRIVLNGMKKLPEPELLSKLERAQELGLAGTQAELQEIKALLKKGFDPESATINGVNVSRKFGTNFGDSMLGGFLLGSGKKAQDFYGGGDDLWKIYNWTFEQSKLKNALAKLNDVDKVAYLKNTDAATANNIVSALPQNPAARQQAIDQMLEEHAARIVRDTVPNYAKSPEFIKQLRKAPVGNFIAFPYEIMRTGVNTIGQGITELASSNARVQAIGLRRLIGASSAFYLAEEGIKKMSELATGVTQDMMEAYKTAAGAPYEKYSTLIATGPADKNGVPSSYVNLTYTNPYGMLTEILNAATSTWATGKALGKNPAAITADAASEVLQQFMSPFFEESIFLGKIRDVLNPESSMPGVSQLAQYVGGRSGRTVTGSRVYNPEDSAGDIAAKSFAHIVDGLLPTVVPVDVRGGRFEPSPILRGAITRAGLNETLGVSAKDRTGRERALEEELGRVFSGMSTQTTNVDRSVVFKGQEMSREIEEANSIWTSVTNRPNVTGGELLQAYKDANAAKYRVMNKFKRVFDAFEQLGMKPEKINSILKSNNIGRYNELYNNSFQPVAVSKTVLQRLARLGVADQLPVDDIVNLQQALVNRPFGSQSLGVDDIVEERAKQAEIEKGRKVVDYLAGAKRAKLAGNTSVYNSLMDKANSFYRGLSEDVQQQVQESAQAVDSPIPTAPQQAIPQPAIPTTRPANAPVPSALMGGNPFDQLRNMEIFQRRQGQ
jgi:hypothetical protein